jgi:hypothetical protein
MSVVLRILGGLLAIASTALLVVFVHGRFSDGPVGFFSGGPLTSGEVVEAPIDDWSFARDVPTIEFQLVEPPRSRTVWIVAEDGVAYIPCGVPNFRLWKQWPHEALADGRAVLRIDGKLYAVKLSKVDDEALAAKLLTLVGEKYSLPSSGGGPDSVWFFRIHSRPFA